MCGSKTPTHNFSSELTKVERKMCKESEEKLQFFIPMIIPTVTDQEHRVGINKNGKPYIYKDAKLKAARAKIKDSLAAFVPDEMIAGKPVRFMVKWLFPVKGQHTDGEYKISKPDTDNLMKMLKDVMTELHFWKDDALVASEISEKFYADKPGLFIVIQEL